VNLLLPIEFTLKPYILILAQCGSSYQLTWRGKRLEETMELNTGSEKNEMISWEELMVRSGRDERVQCEVPFFSRIVTSIQSDM